MHLVVITFVLTFSGLVLSEAILSYLGIGIDGSWGQMIDQARDELARDPIIWWNLAAASAALFGLILAVNFVGDAVRDVLDPRTSAGAPVSEPVLRVRELVTSFPAGAGTGSGGRRRELRGRRRARCSRWSASRAAGSR